MTILGFPRQNYILLGPFQSPGVAVPKKAGTPRNWDVRQGYGYSGATLVYAGAGLSVFDVDIFLWEPDQFIAWEIFAAGALRMPLPGLGFGAAMEIKHPRLNMPPINISAVVVKDCTQFEQGPTGLEACTITLQAYRRPLPALARPIAAIPAATAVMPTAQTAAEIEMVKVQAQIKALGG